MEGNQWYSQIALEKVFFMYATVIPEKQDVQGRQHHSSHEGDRRAPYSKTARDMCMIDLEGFHNFVHDCPNLLDQDDFVYKDCEQIFKQQLARRNQQSDHSEHEDYTNTSNGVSMGANFEAFVDILRKIASCKYMGQDPETDYARLLAKHVFLLLGKQMKQSRSKLLHQRQSFSSHRRYTSHQQTSMGSPKGHKREETAYTSNRSQHGNVNEEDFHETENQLRSLVDCSFASSQGEQTGGADDIVHTWEHDLEERTKNVLNIDNNTFTSFRDNENAGGLRSPAAKSPESRRRASQLARSASPIKKTEREKTEQREKGINYSVDSTFSAQNQTGLSRTDSREDLFTQGRRKGDDGQVETDANKDNAIAQETINSIEHRLRKEFDSAQSQVYRSMKLKALSQLELLIRKKRMDETAQRLALVSWKHVSQDSKPLSNEGVSTEEVERLHSMLSEERQRYNDIQATLEEEQRRAERAELQLGELNSKGAMWDNKTAGVLEQESKDIASVFPSAPKETKTDMENSASVGETAIEGRETKVYGSLCHWLLLTVLCGLTLFAALIFAGTTGQLDNGGNLEFLQYIFRNSIMKSLLLRLGSYFAPIPCMAEGPIYVNCEHGNAGNSVFTCDAD